MYPKIDQLQTSIQTHNLQMMDSTFHVSEALALTTGPSGTSN